MVTTPEDEYVDNGLLSPLTDGGIGGIGGLSSSCSSGTSHYLAAAALGHGVNGGLTSTATSSGTGLDSLALLHSDFTIPTSNRRLLRDDNYDTSLSPPADILNIPYNEQQQAVPHRRSIFSSVIQRKYGAIDRNSSSARRRTSRSSNHTGDTTTTTASLWNDPSETEPAIPFYTAAADGILTPSLIGAATATAGSRSNYTYPTTTTTSSVSSSSMRSIHSQVLLEQQQQQQQKLPLEFPLLLGLPSADLDAIDSDATTPPFFASSSPSNKRRGTSQQQQHRHVTHDKTRHAQSLLLGAAFAGLWSASNLTAPNLTEMADAFGFQTEHDRDFYLGSVLALAVSVFSIPTAAAIGLLTDLVRSRKILFVAVLMAGAISAALTAQSQTFWQLAVARWLTGGCMAGSVPIAFSFLGDWFDVSERNAASSGMTAMMGLGIISGQVYAGATSAPWSHAFTVSACIQAVLAVLCLWLIQDPVRGGKEKALQEMLRAGTRYDRQLTVASFYHAVCNNASNFILLWQGFFSSLPWGVIFVFLNDYLSQERGFSVPDATYLVAIFGIGCALGGILGGYAGQLIQGIDRSYLPLFMAVTTLLGIFPFVGLLNSHFTNAHGVQGVLYAGLGGLIASLPAVSVRPCLINVNPPESRGAALTTANLLISLGRGVGPLCISLIQSLFHGVDRKFAFNVTLIVFWTISAFQLLLLMRTLPRDEDAMEAELASYALQTISASRDDEGSVVTIEERMTSFDDIAAKETLVYVRAGIQELRSPFHCAVERSSSRSSDDADDISANENGSTDHLDDLALQRRALWQCQESTQAVEENHKWTDETLLLPRTEEYFPTETTPLVV